MEITNLLIEPTLKHIERELQELASGLPAGSDSFSPGQELLVKVCALLSDLCDLKREMSFLRPQDGALIPILFYQKVRRLKREAHFARRTFLKIKSNEARFEKMATRRNDVSTVAA